MAFNCSFGYKTVAATLLFSSVLIWSYGCSSTNEVGDDAEPILEDSNEVNAEDTTQNEQGNQTDEEFIQLRFENENASVSINLDPNNEFQLNLPGLLGMLEEEEAPPPEEEVEQKIQEVMRNFYRAQQLFYEEDFDGAMEMVDASLELQETAAALGLKGTIYLMIDDLPSARSYWEQAVAKDPEIPTPDIPEIEAIIDDIQED